MREDPGTQLMITTGRASPGSSLRGSLMVATRGLSVLSGPVQTRAQLAALGAYEEPASPLCLRESFLQQPPP